MFQPAFSHNIANMTGNVIREILKLTQQPDVISFAGGMPPTDAFPVEELREISESVFKKYGAAMLQYGTSEGFLPLREYLVDWMGKKGVKVSLEEVIVTSGSQQGIDLAAKAFLNQGDGVVVEKPTYLAAIQIFKLYGANFSFGETDADGFIPSSLDRIRDKHTNKLLYLVPSFQNPTGRTLCGERRKELAGRLAADNLVLIEDDPYGDLRYSGEEVHPIKAYDHNNRVVYLGSFSKIITPGMRVGFAAGPAEIIAKMVIGKQATDVHTSNLAQAIIYEYCTRGYLEPHIETLKKKYAEKRDLMLALMEENFPKNLSWTKPEGGLFIWVELPEGRAAGELFKAAIKEKVAFIPGDSFFVGSDSTNTLRLNFSNADKSQIEEGIVRLGRVMHQFMEQG